MPEISTSRTMGQPSSGIGLRFVIIVLAMYIAMFSIPSDWWVKHFPAPKWGFALATIPSVLVLQHMYYILLVKSRRFDPDWSGQSINPPKPHYDPSLVRADWARNFQSSTLLLRYGIPAVLLLVVGALQFSIFFYQSPMSWKELTAFNDMQYAGALGLAGAYAYTLVHLGIRSYRADLTGGGAIWCVVSLALGPGLAVVAYKALPMKAMDGDGLTKIVIYFSAGLAPRKIIDLITSPAVKWIKGPGLSQQILNNKDLLVIRGITPDIAERLGEEGIEDAYGLAFAEPYHLFRSTSYYPRQILSWIDEALLHYYLPMSADELIKKKAITGAIDLAALYLDSECNAALESLKPLLGDNDAYVRCMLKRISEDQQLIKIWTTYNLLDQRRPEK